MAHAIEAEPWGSEPLCHGGNARLTGKDKFRNGEIGMKRILVPIDGEISDNAVLGSALCVAKLFNAHLDVIYAPIAGRIDLPERIPQRIR